MGSRNQRLLKGILSVFAVFQIVTVTVLPNPESILFRNLWPLVRYGSFLGFNTTWRFFSPNPNVKRIEYEVFSRGEDGELKGEVFQHPPEKDREKSVEIYNRKITNAMFVVTRPELLKELLGPYLCRRHPGAEQIAIHLKGRRFDTIEKSRFQGDTRAEIGEIEKFYVTDLYCNDEARDETN